MLYKSLSRIYEYLTSANLILTKQDNQSPLLLQLISSHKVQKISQKSYQILTSINPDSKKVYNKQNQYQQKFSLQNQTKGNLSTYLFSKFKTKMQQTQQSSSMTGKPKEKGTNQKSIVVMDIKPQSAQTDMMKIKQSIIDNIKMDGLLWGQSRVQDLAYGIKKLVMACVIEDKVSMEEIVQRIQKMDMVQAVDIISFNKV